MIVFGGQEVVDASERFGQLRTLFFSLRKEGIRDHGRVVELLIEWGIFESAVVDALLPDFDSDGSLLEKPQGALLDLSGGDARFLARWRAIQISF